MTEHLTDIIAWAFFAANGGRILAYIPQLIAAWKCENGAKSVSRMTWSYFALAHFTGILYGLLVIHNLQMALVFTGNFVVCVLLLSIVTWKKRRHGQRLVQPPKLTCIVGGGSVEPENGLVARQTAQRRG